MTTTNQWRFRFGFCGYTFRGSNAQQALQQSAHIGHLKQFAEQADE